MESSDGYAIHFIQQYVKREGSVALKAHEAEVRALHSRIYNRGSAGTSAASTDAYMHFRPAFSVPDITP